MMGSCGHSYQDSMCFVSISFVLLIAVAAYSVNVFPIQLCNRIVEGILKLYKRL